MADFQEQQDAGRRMDLDYTREEYKLKARIISSEYAQKCIDLINQYDLSQSCKILLSEIISVHFDPNAMLAINQNINVRKLELKVALNLSVSGYDASDVANPGLLNVQNAIELAFGDFVSRSYLGKERGAIGRTETISHQNYSGLQGTTQQEPKRGFELPWRRGGP